jgi:hypothetical protein
MCITYKTFHASCGHLSEAMPAGYAATLSGFINKCNFAQGSEELTQYASRYAKNVRVTVKGKCKKRTRVVEAVRTLCADCMKKQQQKAEE